MNLRPMDAAAVCNWYDREFTITFPPNERKPLAFILQLMETGCYTVLGLYTGTELLGYATLHRNADYPDYVLLDYLGVTAARRNSGLDGQILGFLEEMFRGKACIIIEAESPVPGGSEAENTLRTRRIGFYERAGCRPVYEIGACGIRCQTLALGPFQDLSAMAEAHQAIYGPDRTDITIPLGADESPAPACWGSGTLTLI